MKDLFSLYPVLTFLNVLVANDLRVGSTARQFTCQDGPAFIICGSPACHPETQLRDPCR